MVVEVEEVVEVAVLEEEEQIEVDEGHEQLPLVLELETAPLASALLVFVEGVAIPQLAVGVALRYRLTLQVGLKREDFEWNQVQKIGVPSAHFPC